MGLKGVSQQRVTKVREGDEQVCVSQMVIRGCEDVPGRVTWIEQHHCLKVTMMIVNQHDKGQTVIYKSDNAALLCFSYGYGDHQTSIYHTFSALFDHIGW